MLIEKSITQFHEKFYIPEIQKLAFHLPHVRILGNLHCDKERHDEYKRRRNLYDVLYRRDYADRVVYSFTNQIQSEYYGGNMYVSIEGIAL